MAHEDLFEDALNVESRFHQQGYNDGLKEGAEQGIAEGRAFGMQNGFDKFFESGRLAGRSVVWANRLPSSGDDDKRHAASMATSTDAQAETLSPLPNNARLEKNIKSLFSLVDPKTLSTENSDAAVQDFDDRLKKAQGKERVIERVVSGPVKDGPKGTHPPPAI
ncbi:putative ORAOV1 family protein-like protein [Hapsidospora chrysogenum ATCC 11550]|uniref:Putative ORAOV1 family protein-like protein n=1 Tax=Hapsidospora chrysogenum (strain ATCC 11550 / CBS 779.69 / DSM 880 / IAM 14645 / JCM 23072 / IMI 49137) TaxID=857340 RepID=A0A086T9Y8_HAPC1|nr:putative ORAOV1 family protein-like protein [Hapsidospora chrysogenum ATCC 11550]